ncbi:CapA family protein [Microbulbifer guangxiensis]|uniref:CapA family protein n=1 Tax=Microbulbifer guangxiensis TaxID=2904249 RepID=UPI001F40A812
MRLLVAGDVMTGRGIDQVLPRPGDPRIHESYLHSATDYVGLTESASGELPRDRSSTYPWGDALSAMDQRRPAVRVINLETSITSCDDYWRGKGINYRMHPANLPCLTEAGIDVCTLANNHVLDWGYGGLAETLENLERSGLRVTGAGNNLIEAAAPAEIHHQGKRVLVFACADTSSGVPREWAASTVRPGVNLLPDLSQRSAEDFVRQIDRLRKPGDLVVVSVHWGGNWGYEIPSEQQSFAHRLVEGGVDLISGHSSHHPKGIEVYRQRAILYGCGDLINDYEGISGHENFRPELRILYSVELDPENGSLHALELVPFASRKLRLCNATPADSEWLRSTLNREYHALGMKLVTTGATLALRWDGAPG